MEVRFQFKILVGIFSLHGASKITMYFVLNHAFNRLDIFRSFKLKKLKYTSQFSIENYKANRRVLACKIFHYSLRIMLEDLIVNNHTFKLPLSRDAYIGMRRTTGEEFKRARRNGKWEDVDYLASNFTGYQLEYVCHYTHRTVNKPIYVDTPLRNLITKYTNEGRNYTLTNFTTYKDYVDRTRDAFPGICKKDVETILKYGWKSIYLHNAYGGDVCIECRHKRQWFYMGRLTFDSLKFFFYVMKKHVVKARLRYNKRHELWDGYYYFAITDKEFEKYKSQIHKTGRKRKHYKFDFPVVLFKIKEECWVRCNSRRHLFRIPTGLLLGYSFYKPKGFIADNAEYLGNIGFRNLSNLGAIYEKRDNKYLFGRLN